MTADDLDLSHYLAEAEAARLRVNTDPSDAAAKARQVLTDLAVTRQPRRSSAEATSVALRALGLAVKELGRARDAERHLRRAVRVAETAGLTTRAAEARLSLVVVLHERGDNRAALEEADRAGAVLTGADAGRLHAQRSLVLQRMGRYDDALIGYRRALPLLRRAGDVQFECLVLLRRGTLHVYRGAHQTAERDLLRCRDLAQGHGLHLLRGFALHNLGFAAFRAGDVPGALSFLDQALGLYAQHSRPSAPVLMDRAEVLAAAGLAAEAREAASAAIEELDARGFAADLAEALVVLARAAALDGDHEAAHAAAAEAVTAFRRQHRPAWATLARSIEVRARWDAGERTARLMRLAAGCADQLNALGWQVESAQNRLIAARLVIEVPIPAADCPLQDLARNRSRGPAQSRAIGWHAEALRRLAAGRTGSALRALDAGLRVLEDNSATLGATDLRANATRHGEELASTALGLLMDRRRARDVLAWTERWRAGALRSRPVRPPDDRRLAADLARLRQLVATIAEEGLAGRDTTPLQAERARLEAAIRDRSRHTRGQQEESGPVDLEELAGQLGDRVLLSLSRHDGRLFGVTLVDGRSSLWALGSYDEAIGELQSLRFSMHRLARQHGSPAALDAARLGLKHASTRLDELLLEPVQHVIAGREIVLLPTMALHALPWTTLPSLATRPVSIAPSAALWLRAVQRQPRGWRAPRPVLVAGPGLEHARPEVAELAGNYQAAHVLTEDSATAEAVLKAMDGADLVHVAAHGRFRADNPQFSCLELADGPLTVYDLERLRRAPRRLVLSACDSALSAVHPGDELMGLAAAVFALGTSTLIASVTPVPDEETRTLMVDLHERLARGTPPARALAEAQQATEVDGFVCFGAG